MIPLTSRLLSNMNSRDGINYFKIGLIKPLLEQPASYIINNEMIELFYYERYHITSGISFNIKNQFKKIRKGLCCV